jgi:hypothetical protein
MNKQPVLTPNDKISIALIATFTLTLIVFITILSANLI